MKLGLVFVFGSTALAILAGCGSSASTEDTATTGATGEALSTVCAGGATVQGIDVSHYQGSINWASEKSQGRVFGVASVGDGTYEDPTFATNWAGMKSAGVIRGAYQFFEPADDPTTQANILISKVGMLGEGDLPATLDVEVTGSEPAATIAARIQTWVDAVTKGTGRAPMIYTGPYFWEDNVASNAFSKLPLWVADYGPKCPLLPSAWSNFKIWQYSDSNGSLDVDEFNGTLADLQAFARPPDQAPKGYLDSVTCTAIAGWAFDGDVGAGAIATHVYFDGQAGASGAQALAITANVARADLCSPLGSCNHGFTLDTPVGLMDGQAHTVYAYGIDNVNTGTNTLLTGSPKSFMCAPPTIPLDDTKGELRHVTDPTSFTAWKFNSLTDVAHEPQATVAQYTEGADLPATPDVIIADDGSPSVWVVDGGQRRHVVSPASMTAWRFGTPVTTPAAQVSAMTQGPDWPAAPFLIQGDGPAVYALDGAPFTPPGSGNTGAPTSGDSTATGDGSSDPGAANDPSATGGTTTPSASSGSSGGCSASPSRSSSGGSLATFGLGAFVFLSGRRRRPTPTEKTPRA